MLPAVVVLAFVLALKWLVAMDKGWLTTAQVLGGALSLWLVLTILTDLFRNAPRVFNMNEPPTIAGDVRAMKRRYASVIAVSLALRITAVALSCRWFIL